MEAAGSLLFRKGRKVLGKSVCHELGFFGEVFHRGKQCFRIFLIKFASMKKNILFLAIALVALVGCRQSEDEKAAPTMRYIDSLYQAKNYPATLQAIRELRRDHPKAIESRKRALKIWQDASLKMTQEDIARTDSALQAVTKEWKQAKDLRTKNMLGVKRDSLQIRYDALCGTVRVIHKRQQE
jgi:hypothetical protein